MDNINLLDYFTENNNGLRVRESWLRDNNYDLYSKIINFNKEDSLTFKEKIYLYINNTNKPPKCEVCGVNDVKFISLKKGYNKNCSIKCGVNNQNTKNKIKETNVKKYGVTSPLRNDEIKNKVKKTNLEKYGVTCSLHNDEIKNKVKKTNLERYGFTHHWYSDDIKNLRKENLIKKYGVSNPFQLEEVKEKSKKTNLTKFNVENYSQSEEFKNVIFKNKIIDKLNNFSGYTFIDYENKVLTLKCDKCDKIFKIDNYLFNQRKRLGYEICINCFPLNGSNYTKPHRDIVSYIENLTGMLVEINNKKILGGCELDIFIPQKNLAIEYDGLYWHSEINKSKTYHINKTLLCKDKNIKLLHIFEDEWLFKKDIVLSIIKANLNIFDTNIFARKCVIKTITNKESSKFLGNNHIQGSVNASINLGLYYKDELVSVMTFGNRSGVGNNNYEYEMLRFCNKLNTKIVGGASKLFGHFIQNYKPKNVVSYSDNRYFDGGLYEKLGFKFLKNTELNYWYFKDLVRMHRYNFRKDKLIKDGYDPNKTEKQIMYERGYNIIWDCGNKKWVWGD